MVRDQKGYDAILTISLNLIVGCCCCFSDGTLNPAGVRFGSAEIYNIGEESWFFSRGNRMAIYSDGRWATFCLHWTVDSFGSCLFPTLVTRSWLISSFWKTFPIYSHGALDSTDLSSIQGVYHIWTMKWPRSSEISLWFSGRTSERGIRKFRVQFLLSPVVRRPISTNPRLNFNRVVYFFVQERILDYVPHSF